MTIRTLELLACLALLCLCQIIVVSASSSASRSYNSNSLPKTKLHGNGNGLIKKTIGNWGTLPSEKKQLLNFRGGEQSDTDEYDSETEYDTDTDSDSDTVSDNKSETEVESDSCSDSDGDEERYSRQFYTLGARAHGLVRSSTIVVDGPAQSGLVYEAVKNLALSGVGKIILLTKDKSDEYDSDSSSSDEEDEDDDETTRRLEDIYYNSKMDDLGSTYRNGAIAECFANHQEDAMDEIDDVEIMVEYILRLNPSVKIKTMGRNEFLSGISADETTEDDDDDTAMDTILGCNSVLLCIDRPLSTQQTLNDACRNLSDSMLHSQKSIPFVSIETAGVYGKAFCDFGDEFHVVDEDGEEPKATLLEDMTISEEEKYDGEVAVLNCIEGERHDVSKGDLIEFQCKSSDSAALKAAECEVVYVKNPTCFTVKFRSKGHSKTVKGEELDALVDAINDDANSFSRIKVPKPLPFLSLREALASQDNPRKEIFAASDLDKSFDYSRRKAVMSSFASLEEYVRNTDSLPSSNDEDGIEFQRCLDKEGIDNMSQKITSSFANTAKAKFAPLQAIYGALGAQEALKAATGLYNPIRQFLLYDCDEVLTRVKKSNLESTEESSGMAYIFGKKFVKKFASKKIFVVGSGAIGCEILKNLAAMDVGTMKNKKKTGEVILTDMDTIEKSNLSRQLLFRDGDVGKFKSVAAQEAMKRMNSKVNMNVHTSKVGDDPTGQSVFDDSFWSSGVDIVLNALDNVEARLFIDSQCVANKKALIDAGTLGAKGNVQVVVPKKSESYGSSADPPEPTIPVCTLKNFPYEISHTIQWGRDLFDGLYNRRPSQINEQKEALSTMELSHFARELLAKVGEDVATEMAEELAEDMIFFDPDDDAYASQIRSAALNWALDLATKLYDDAMSNLLEKHPLDSLDDDEKPFWSGARRAPTPLSYREDITSPEQEIINENLTDFIRYAARLRIEAYDSGNRRYEDGLVTTVSTNEARELLSSSIELKRQSSKAKKPPAINWLKEAKDESSSLKYDLNAVDFEKDDDSNGHVAFVTAASNLRAIAYGITPVDQMETRKVAGKIVPAMITTTAFVSALSCIEFVKLTQKADLKLHRNAFINLALPFFAFTAPLPAEEIDGLDGSSHTIWDRIVVKESKKNNAKGGMTMKQLIRKVVSKSHTSEEKEIAVSNISWGEYMLYANFLHEDDDTLLNTPVQQLLVEAVSSGDIEDEDFDSSDDEDSSSPKELNESQLAEIDALKKRSFANLSVLVEDTETGEEAELAPIRLQWWKE